MVNVPLTVTYSAAGTYTWVAPPGVTSVACAATGGGGGAGSCNATSGSNGGGGGGGATSYEPALPVTPGTAYTVIVGAGGLGGNFTTGASSTAGGISTFQGDSQAGVLIVVLGTGGNRGTVSTSGSGPHGAGGTTSSNTISAAGGNGSDGTVSTNGGAGGGAAGVSATAGFPGGNGSGSTGGLGGLGTFPGGAGAAGSTSGASNGANGSGPGGGGGGALSTGTGRNGGNGADGQVVITWTSADPVTLPNNMTGGTLKFQAPLGITAVKAEAVGAGAGGFNSASASGTATCGCSAFTVAYGSPRSAAAATFDQRVNRPMALASQVTYYDEEEYPSSAATDSQATAALTTMGAKIIAVFKCSRRAVVAGGSTLTAQQTQLSAAIAYLLAVPGINLGAICIGNEPGIFGSAGPFGDATQKNWKFPAPYGTGNTNASAAANFLAYWAAYIGTVTTALAGTGIPVWFKPTVTSQPTSILMFPGALSSAGGCDGVFIDWYATDNPKGSATPFGSTNMEGTCDKAGVGLGLGEWGASGGSNVPALTDWNSYISRMNTGFSNRFNNGKPVIDVVYFGGLSTTGPNTVQAPSGGVADYKVTGIQQINDLFTGSHPVGGAGGGGGEYAAEGSLAITGLKSYTLVVGTGGGGMQSGTNTTIAGDSVTVTGHAGLVATTAGTGGTGGTGSGNTTHNNGGQGGAGGGTGGAGGGGGSSGGSAAAGNAGTAGTGTLGGAGGAAVTGGGPGGSGGSSTGSGHAPTSGPGGGGGARGATGSANGTGFDGQITLSNFVTGTGAAGNCQLASLGSTGTVTINAGNCTLASLASNASGTVGGFTLLHNNNTIQNSGTGVIAITSASSTKGSLLIAVMASGGTTAITAPANWVNAAALAEGGGTGGRLEMWFLPGHLNPGGITSTTFTGNGTSDTIRGSMSEWQTPVGTTQALNGTAGTASGAAPATSFPVSYAGSANVGDLGMAAFADKFTVATSGSWGGPAGYSQLAANTGSANWFAPWSKTGLSAGTQSVTSTASTSTNQSGWAAILAVFTIVTLNTLAGTCSLAQLAANATGSSTIPANTVVGQGSAALSPLNSVSPSLAITFPEEQLPITVEIQTAPGVWADISAYVYQRDGINLTNRGRPNEASTAQPAQCTITLDNRDGSFSPQNTAGQFYPYLVRNGLIRVSVKAVTSTGAQYSGYRFYGQVPAWPPLWNPAATDVYVQITAVGILQRMLQSKYSASPLARYYTNIMNNALNANPGMVPIGIGLVPAGYWPCEDNINSASFASGIPGGSPMTWTGTPFLSGDSTVPGSAPFAQLNGSTWTGATGAFSSGGYTFSQPGNWTWTCPADVTSITVECWGGGGGGADGIYGTGGAGGEYAKETNVAVTPGNVYNLTVGTGGTGAKGAQDSSAGGPGAQPTTGGTRSTFAGDTENIVAHGGQGAINSNSGSANGGTGSHNTTHHDGGAGGASGRAALGGSSGGSSGGQTSNGNNGTAPSGRGGAPATGNVAGGGPGGAGGNGQDANGGTSSSGLIPFPGPGGGGGGGGFNSTTHYGRAGGGGQNGQVTLTYGASTKPSANVIRAVIDMQGGGTSGSQWLQAVTNGTVHFLNLTFQGSGNLQLRGRDASNNLLFDSGTVNFSVANATPLLVSVELTQTSSGQGSGSGPGILRWRLHAINLAGTVVNTATGTVAGVMGSVTQMNVNNFTPDTQSTGIGHVSVQYALDPLTNLANAFNAFIGETAEARFLRLCLEERIPVQIITSVLDTPSNPDTPAMGPQPTDLLVNLLQDCENVDLGQMFERRDAFGLGYRTRASLQNQPATATLDYSQRQLGADLTPTNDEQLIRNDVVVTRGNGGFFNQVFQTVSGNRVIVPAQNTGGTSYEFLITSGPLSVLDPPNGVGLYQYQVTVNVQSDSQLAAFALWILTLGTLDEYRYPQIVFDLMRPAVRDGTFGAIADLDIGNMVTINNPPSWLPQYAINQLCFGFSEKLNGKQWIITVNAVPADPYISTSPFPEW